MRRARCALLCVVLTCLANVASGAPLPPSCATVAAPADEKTADETTAISELRARVEAANETNPQAAFALLCATVPRVEREYGQDSPELAWWMGSLATPLIAYMDKFDEAIPILQYVQPILTRQSGPYGEALGDVYVAYGWIYLRQGKLAQSRAAWEEALKVRERFPGARQIELQKVLAGLAQVQISQRDFPGALRTLDRMRAMLLASTELVSEAGAALENAYTNVALREERFADARQHAESQLRIEGQLAHGAQQLVPAYALLGRILERLNEYEQAEQSLGKAIALSEGDQGPLQRHHFSALYQLAVLLEERGHPVQAHERAAQALALGEATLGAQAPKLVPVLQVLGDSERHLGQLSDALRRFERAGAIIASDGANVERQWQVDYYRDLGALQMTLGDPAGATSTLETGLRAAGADVTLSVARARLHLDHARALTRLGRQGAPEELQHALTLLRSRLPESHPAILRVLNELCALELTAPNAPTPNCDSVLARLTAVRDSEPGLRAEAYDNLSRLALLRSDTRRALQHAVRALAAAEASNMPEPLWQAHLQLAQVLRRRHQLNIAIFFGKQALTQVERERRSFVGADEHLDSAFLRDKVAAYREVADWLFERRRVDEGLAVLAMMKREELYGFGVRAARDTSEHDVELTAAEAALKARYNAATRANRPTAQELRHLGALQESERISPTERDRLNALLAGRGAAETSRSAQIEQLLSRSKIDVAAETSRDRMVSAPALAKAALAFGPDTAFAVYLLTDTHLRVLVTARGAQTEFRSKLDSAQLQREIGHFLDDIVQRRDTTAMAQHLYAVIARDLDRFATRHRVHRLALWLDGALRYVPIAALHDGQRYLVDKYVIQSYAPAAAGALHVPHWPHAQIRGFGVTQPVGGFPALPGVAEELCNIVRGNIEGLQSKVGACASPSEHRGVLEGQGFADAAFTAARFTQLLDTPHPFSVLHIGTHFRLRPGNALRSFLLLGDGTRLTLEAISALDFAGIDVVTLSACETGRGGARTDDGREVEGLSALVQRRGAGHVLASLWQVEDASTAALMRTLYAAYDAAQGDAAQGDAAPGDATHGDAAVSLQQAQRALRSTDDGHGRSYAHPYYWAGFSVYGSAP